MSTIDFSTDQTGANTPISSSGSIIFNFSVPSTYTAGKGTFSIKKGTASTNGVTATINSGLNGSGSSLFSVFVSQSNISTSYALTDFVLNYVLSAGSYSLVLSTTDPSGGSTQYSIKAGSFQATNSVDSTVLFVYDSNGNVVNPTSTPTPTPTSTPIPTSTPSATGTSTPIPTSTPSATGTSTPIPTLTPSATGISHKGGTSASPKQHGHGKLTNRGGRFMKTTKRFYSFLFYRTPGSAYEDND